MLSAYIIAINHRDFRRENIPNYNHIARQTLSGLTHEEVHIGMAHAKASNTDGNASIPSRNRQKLTLGFEPEDACDIIQ